MISDEKKTLRKELLQKREALSDEFIKNTSDHIFDKIKKLECYKKAQTVMVYVSYNKELNTHEFIKEMIAEGKTVVTPTCIANNEMKLCVTKTFPEGFSRSKLGIMEIKDENAETVSPKELDLIITPGLAYTLEGKRLGYGGGYYDRLFERISDECIKVCPSYDDFLVDNIPTDFHDVPVDIIVTESKTIFVK